VYFCGQRHPGFAYECMEAFGGNGYVEDFPMAMLFRQSPLNSIWEGNIVT
jgi:putative acyl-CoA dehydrogenase